MTRTLPKTASLLLLVCSLAACQTNPPLQNATGVSSMDVDPSRKGPVSGVGVESQDILAMTDQMMRDMLAEQIFAETGKRPRVIIDAQYFVNESSQAINKNLITQRLMTNLNRAARSRMQFINRQNTAMIAKPTANAGMSPKAASSSSILAGARAPPITSKLTANANAASVNASMRAVLSPIAC